MAICGASAALAIVFAVAWFRTMVLDDSISELGKPPLTIHLVDWADEEGARFGKRDRKSVV